MHGRIVPVGADAGAILCVACGVLSLTKTLHFSVRDWGLMGSTERRRVLMGRWDLWRRKMRVRGWREGLW